MPFRCSKTPIVLNQEDRDLLQRLSVSRTESVRRVERAHLLLRLVDGVPPKTLAQESRTHITTVYRLLNKALECVAPRAYSRIERQWLPTVGSDHRRGSRLPLWCHPCSRRSRSIYCSARNVRNRRCKVLWYEQKNDGLSTPYY